ncbi:MAG: cupin domain-containing protein [Gemmatimonadales bacterium]
MPLAESFQHLPSRAVFAADRMTKSDCFRSKRLLVGLNCFEPGQGQPVHAHADADKFYVVVSGKARFRVGERAYNASAGDLVLAPAGEPHGVERAEERTVVLVAMAPAPTETGGKQSGA